MASVRTENLGRIRNMAALSHGLDEEDVVPSREIDRAIERAKQVKRNPDKYTADINVLVRTCREQRKALRRQFAVSLKTTQT